MTCRPCTYLQESVADCLPTSFSDTSQLSLWSGNPTPAKSCENEPQMDGSTDCTCGKAMCDCSIHPNTPEKWIASMRDSLAKTLALLESKQAYLREPEAVFTEKSCALLASFDPATCSWKTLQQSFLTDSEPFSATWPRWGMTAGGSAYAHPMSGRRITEIDGLQWPTVGTRGFTNDGDLMALGKKCESLEEMNGMAYRAAAKKKAMYWPTPMAGERDASPRWMKTRSGGLSLEPNLAVAVKMWPTPRANDAEKRGNFNAANKRNGLPAAAKLYPTPTTNDAKNSTLPESLRFRDGMAGALMRDGEKAGGQLNPDWVAWLMGFPIAWANSKATEMRKFRSKPQPLGDCSAVNEVEIAA